MKVEVKGMFACMTSLFPVETQHTHLFTPDRYCMTDPSTKVQSGDPVNFIGVTERNSLQVVQQVGVIQLV